MMVFLATCYMLYVFMKIKFCGAAQNVTGSRHLLEVNGKKILLDCGMVQGGNPDEARMQNEHFLFEPSQVDYMVLSHAHIDHVGMTPRLTKQGFRGQIFCTTATKELANVLLLDAAHIQLQDSKYIQKKFKTAPEPLFTDHDVQFVIKLMAAYEYRQKFKICEGVWATFYDAGHVLGSAITVFEIKEGNTQRILIYTGDLGRKYLPILNDPVQVPHGDFLITESTYGGHLHGDIKDVSEELAVLINKVVARKGKIIIPGFSFERTQEIVYVLHKLYKDNKVPEIPIFVDSPLSSKISQIFGKFVNYYDDETFRDFLSKKNNPFYFDRVKYIEAVEESKKLNTFEGSCIIISSSGMCEAGRIKHHLRNHMGDANNLIVVVGFMAKGTRGRQLVDGATKIRIFGQMYPRRAEVAILNAFSAHADKIELLEYIRNIKDLKKIFIVHGEVDQSEALKDNIQEDLKFTGEITVPELGQEFEI